MAADFVTKASIRFALSGARSMRKDGQPILTYFHPWEIDPGQPRLAGKLKSRLRHYFNLKRMEGKVRELLRGGRFAPLKELLEARLAKGPLPEYPLVTTRPRITLSRVRKS